MAKHPAPIRARLGMTRVAMPLAVLAVGFPILIQSIAATQARAQWSFGPGEARDGAVREEPTEAEWEHIRRVLGQPAADTSESRLTTLLSRPKMPGLTELVPVNVKMPDPVLWQAALDRSGFSPGIIDGITGKKTKQAIEAYQKWAGLQVTGLCDASTRGALGVDNVSPGMRWVLSKQDLTHVGPHPSNWNEKARLDRLRYESVAAMVAERGHCSQKLLAKLNPGLNLNKLKAGDSLVIPNVTEPAKRPRAALVEINFAQKALRVFDNTGSTIALMYCSIAKHTEHRPSGECRVKSIILEPEYTFNPKSWPEVKNVKRVLTIPSGPRNPVGLCWIGLSIKGYGIHGTPQPELIGKTGSHGCFRLTNWDAIRLAEMVRVGTEVRFRDDSTSDGSRTE